MFGDQAVVAIGWWVLADEQAESGCAACRCLHVVAGKLPALAGEFVDIRAVDVFVAVAGELGIQVVDADEQNICWFCMQHERADEQKADNWGDFHGNEIM